MRMSFSDTEQVIKNAYRIVEEAQAVRRDMRRNYKKGDPVREMKLQTCIDSLSGAARGLKRIRALARYHGDHRQLTEKMEAASKDVQVERRKLSKMKLPRRVV